MAFVWMLWGSLADVIPALHSIPQDPGETALLPLSVPAPLQAATANPITEAPGIILLPHIGFLSLKERRDEISIFSLSCYASF